MDDIARQPIWTCVKFNNWRRGVNTSRLALLGITEVERQINICWTCRRVLKHDVDKYHPMDRFMLDPLSKLRHKCWICNKREIVIAGIGPRLKNPF